MFTAPRPRLLLVTLVIACAPAIDDLPADPGLDLGPASLPERLVAPPAPGPIDSTLGVSAPPAFVIGAAAHVEVTGAAPGQAVRLYGSVLGPGTSAVCPPVYHDNCVDLRSPIVLGTAVADATGRVGFDGVVRPTAPATPVWLQAFAAADATLGLAPNRSPVLQVDRMPPCLDDAWWAGADVDGDGAADLRSRILVEVSGPAAPLLRAPVSIDVDFRAVLDGLGEPGAFDPNSLHVVRQDCALGFPELPAQFVDELVSLDQKVAHDSPIGDEAGAVVLLVDEDGDLSTPEPFGPGQTSTFGLYFTTPGVVTTPVVWPTDLTVTPGATVALANSVTTLILDPARGGLMSELSTLGSGSLTSQTTSCCGNSMHFWNRATAAGPPFGWVTPQSAPGTVTVAAYGSLLAAVRSTGTRHAIVPATGADYGTYDYDDLYWMFAWRPEVWHSLHHVAVTDCTTEHDGEASYAFRPVQVRHTPLLITGATYENDDLAPWATVTGPQWGVAFGLNQPPAWFARVSSPLGSEGPGPYLYDYMALQGSEIVGVGVPSPVTVPAGIPIFDHVGALFLPYPAPLADHRDELEALMTGATVGAVVAEALP